MNLEAVASVLESAGVGTAGKDIFINFIPGDIEGILLRDYFGGTPRDHELPGYIQGAFMLIARGKDYKTTHDLCKAAVAALEAHDLEEVVEGAKFNYMRGRTLPFSYSSSPAQQWEVTVTIDACYVDVA
jgi:hypothetical protein